ncbi:potassium channel family protein [Streptomyces sp. NPDC020719]|uniref:potassium channel family protein n=1 Tax=Streptomyces sp. NPDC020719 TaxID=3154896 RepID=UPI0033D6945B
MADPSHHALAHPPTAGGPGTRHHQPAAYYLLERADPGSFSEPLTRTDALYFTLVTFSTVGYGDITAQSEAAPIVTMAQVTGDLLLLGVASRIVVTAARAGSGGGGTRDTGR